MSPSKFMLEALALAKEAEKQGDVPVGAVVVFQDQIIGRGFNHKEKNQDPTGHAEILAIQSAAKHLQSWRLIDCDLYVTLEPCHMCLASCQQARVRRVIYGAVDPKGGAICLGFHVHSDPKLNHQFEVQCEPMSECSEILSQFFLRRRNEQKSAKLKA